MFQLLSPFGFINLEPPLLMGKTGRKQNGVSKWRTWRQAAHALAHRHLCFIFDSYHSHNEPACFLMDTPISERQPTQACAHDLNSVAGASEQQPFWMHLISLLVCRPTFLYMAPR